MICVRDLCHKYVFRFRDCLNQFQFRFPGASAIQLVNVGNPAGDGYDFSAVVRGLEEQRRHIATLDGLYRTRPLPLVTDAQATSLAADIRAAQTAEQLDACTGRLKKLSYRLQFVAEDQVELRGALVHLLQLIVENISELVVDDQWLQGQVSLVRDLLGQPLDLRRLDDVERRLKDLIYKQSALKKSLNDAQAQLKGMLATFVDRLADFAATTGDYHDRIGACAEKISSAADINQLSDVLNVVMQETRAVQFAAQRSRDELLEMRDRVRQADAGPQFQRANGDCEGETHEPSHGQKLTLTPATTVRPMLGPQICVTSIAPFGSSQRKPSFFACW